MGAKKVFILEGLDCANCGAKIERAINSLEEVTHASVDFMNLKLIIEAEEKNLEMAIEKSKKVISDLEPDVKLKSKGEKVNRPNKANACDSGCGEEHDHHDHSHSDNDEHGHDHDGHDHSGGIEKSQVIKLIVGTLILVLAKVLPINEILSLTLLTLSYIIIGGEIVLRAGKNILKGRVFDENFLMSIATIGAFLIGEHLEGVAVMLFYQVGELFQSYAVNRSRKSIAGLMDIRPDYANLKVGEEIKKVDPEEVEIGDIIIVKAGEKIPLDGKVINGVSLVDTSALTGESVPREVSSGSDVLSGCINTNGLLTIEVTKEFGESTVAKILDLVENASSKKANTENFITKFARIYTPAVVIIAAILAIVPPLVISGATFSDWIYRALTFLVISCPCALVISIPLGFFGGIGAASKNGVLVKGSNYLEALASTEIVVFDKTGTLTKGVFKVSEINAEDISKEELLKITAYAESYSNHPISKSIMAAFNEEIDNSQINESEEISGHGVRAVVFGKAVLAGNEKLMKRENINYYQGEVLGTVVHVAIDGKYAGYITIADEIKEDSSRAIQDLKEIGVKKTVMLTGDTKSVGLKVANILGLDKAYTELLPADKVEKMEELLNEKSEKGKLAFVGDGINDAGAMRAADVGISVDTAVDVAKESADVILLRKDLMVLEKGILSGRRVFTNTMKYVKLTASSNFGNVFSVIPASIFLPFLPIAPIQSLLLNLIYDTSCMSVPWDKVDEEYVEKPKKWEPKSIGNFMRWFGPTSSIFDIVTYLFMYFIVCPAILGGSFFELNGADQLLFIGIFHAGWFIESLWSQMLVLHFLRTEKMPFLQSSASGIMTLVTTAGIVLGTVLPFTAFGAELGFVGLSPSYFLYLIPTIVAYLALVAFIKVLYVKRYGQLL